MKYGEKQKNGRNCWIESEIRLVEEEKQKNTTFTVNVQNV